MSENTEKVVDTSKANPNAPIPAPKVKEKKIIKIGGAGEELPKIEFNNYYEFEGKTVDSITIRKPRTKNVLNAYKAVASRGIPTSADQFQIVIEVASDCSDTPSTFFEGLEADDFLLVVGQLSPFLM